MRGGGDGASSSVGISSIVECRDFVVVGRGKSRLPIFK